MACGTGREWTRVVVEPCFGYLFWPHNVSDKRRMNLSSNDLFVPAIAEHTSRENNFLTYFSLFPQPGIEVRSVHHHEKRKKRFSSYLFLLSSPIQRDFVEMKMENPFLPEKYYTIYSASAHDQNTKGNRGLIVCFYYSFLYISSRGETKTKKTKSVVSLRETTNAAPFFFIFVTSTRDHKNQFRAKAKRPVYKYNKYLVFIKLLHNKSSFLSFSFVNMNFSTSSSATLCLLAALTATSFSPDSLAFVSAEPLLLSKQNNNNESPESKNEFTMTGSSSPQFEVPAAPSLHAPDNNNGSLTLIGLDPTKLLTKAEAAFFWRGSQRCLQHVSWREWNEPGDTIRLHPAKYCCSCSQW